MFQSLNRAYKRSDQELRTALSYIENSFNPSIGLTSVPTSLSCSYAALFNTFQSLNRAYKRSDVALLEYKMAINMVSIPQSGLQAFRRWFLLFLNSPWGKFQSLNRAYKRSDQPGRLQQGVEAGGFNPSIGLTSVPTGVAVGDSRPGCRFNPSIGLTSVPTYRHLIPV